MNHAPTLREIRKQGFPILERLWNDPQYAAEMEAERVKQQAIMNAEWDARLEKWRNRND